MFMTLTRTTLRIQPHLKKAAQKLAAEENMTLQELFNHALETYLNKKTQKKARKMIIPTINLGVNLDNLTREDFYGDRF